MTRAAEVLTRQRLVGIEKHRIGVTTLGFPRITNRKEGIPYMSRCRGFRLRSMIVSTALIALGGGAQATELPLTRVVLSTSGIAQFTHAGPVTAGSTVDLAVRFDQVDDILKSLTVFDKAGAIGPVSLPGKAPLAELFRDSPFGPDALDSSRALLNALVGSEVEVSGQVNAKSCSTKATCSTAVCGISAFCA